VTLASKSTDSKASFAINAGQRYSGTFEPSRCSCTSRGAVKKQEACAYQRIQERIESLAR
jgi:hypothetical protein